MSKHHFNNPPNGDITTLKMSIVEITISKMLIIDVQNTYLSIICIDGNLAYAADINNYVSYK